MTRILAVFLVCGLAAGQARGQAPRGGTKTKNVVLVVSDGLRWQEVFRGVDPELLNKTNGGVADPTSLKAEFARPTPVESRSALFPFLWGKVGNEGQLLGDADHGAAGVVTNGKNFSYPGYNELFTGWPDPRIDSNDKVQNPNATVFEWLAGRPGLEGRVAAYGSWDVFPFILRRGRSGIHVVAGWESLQGGLLSQGEKLLDQVIGSTHRIWESCCFDAFTSMSALEYLKREHPRVLFIGLGETDEFAHEGRYDHYLHSAHRADASLKRLWEALQAMPEYRDSTTLLVTADHGRGDAPIEWKSHGAKVKGSERVWLAAIGPDTEALGARAGVTFTQSQIAATMAALLGLDYRASVPKAAPPIEDLLPRMKPHGR